MMAFTIVTLEGTYEPRPMSNGGIVAPVEPVQVTLDEHGHFSVQLFANDDTVTVPQGVEYGVTETLTGAQPRDYFIVLAHNESKVNIATLMPGEPGWE
jgi:hypothetical protein